jgi:hypothetical protein
LAVEKRHKESIDIQARIKMAGKKA